MIEVVGFCVLCFVIVDFFWLTCTWVWIILMDTVLVSLYSHGGACERFVSILDWVTKCELLSRLAARGSWRRLLLSFWAEFGIVASWWRALHYTAGALCCSGFASNNMFELCAPLWLLEDFYKWK